MTASPSASNSLANSLSASTSTWHTVNPQTRPLTLSILELTPLALTLSLTLSPFSTTPPASSSHHTPTQHVAHTHNHAHGPKHRKKVRHKQHSDDEDDHLHDDHHMSPVPGAWPHALVDPSTNFKDLLSHGVVVSVNGQPWNRIVAHVSDPEEETETGEEPEIEGSEWEDDPAGAGTETGNEEMMTPGGEGVTKRRPRKARFGSAAGNAVKGDDKGSVRRKRRPSEVKDRMREDRDRAVVVVYGLSPGKEYEIELQVVGLSAPDAGDPFVVSNSVLIPPSPSPLGQGHPRSRANSLRSRSRPRSRSNSFTGHGSHTASATHSSDVSIGASPGRITPPVNGSDGHLAPPIPTNILNPIDTQAAQIRHMIAAAHAEKEHVQTQIKEARRASQRAEAALRLEIETVKKATEKAGSLDLRAKQKALALQEQVKQGWAGAENAEKETTSIEDGTAEQEGRLESTKAELEAARDEWKSAKDKEEEIREREKRNRAEEEKNLQEVVGKIDKLRVKKEKKESEKAELQKKLEDLLKQAEEIEKKNEDEQTARSKGAYWWDPYTQHGHGHGHHANNHGRGHGHDSHAGGGRGLTNHPSLNNLSGHGGFAQRGRGFGGRFPSAGSTRPTPAQPSPTHATGFHGVQHPIPPNATTSPAFRPPKLGAASPAANTRTPSSTGVNVSAMPFHPSNYPTSPGANQSRSGSGDTNSLSNTPSNGENMHTTLMPPQLQHRIYPPNVRPRPNFNPPPSVLAERQSPTMASAPSFPPLPGTSGSSAAGQKAAGPSLASIVTRAVLSPTALAERGMTSSPGPGQHAGGTPLRSPTYPVSPIAGTPTASSSSATGSTPAMPPGATGAGRAVTFGPPPDRSPNESMGFNMGNNGPWSGLGNLGNAAGYGMVRTSTPPVMGAVMKAGRDSPGNQSHGSSGVGSGAGSRKGTAD